MEHEKAQKIKCQKSKGGGGGGGWDIAQKTDYFQVNLVTECKRVSFQETWLGTVKLQGRVFAQL